MQDIIHFITSHWELSLALVVILLLILGEEIKGKMQGGKQVSPQALVQLMNHENALVLDLRESEDFKKEHIVSAFNLPSKSLDKHLKKLTKYKTKPVVLVDDKGTHTSQMATQLKSKGFQQLHTLAGGLAAWKTAQLPLKEGKKK